jgi:hypothetical protein
MMSDFRERYGPWALVTGASSGIGEEFARQLAARGLDLVLVARRNDRLEALAEQLRAEHKVRTRVAAVDLSRRDFLPNLQAATDGLEIGLLVNNAGVGYSGRFLDHDLERELAMLDVNCRAPLILAHVFGRPMRDRRRGAIIWVSSILGYMPAPFAANYAATKAYDLFMGEALWYELRDSGVDVLVLCPGETKSEFHRVAAGYDRSGGMPVGPVVAAALTKLGRTPSVVAGWSNRALISFQRLLPKRAMIVSLGKIMKSMGRAKRS